MSVAGVLGLAKVGMGLIDKFIPDKDANTKAKMELLEMEKSGELQEFMSAAGIVEAEAKSEHWLTANWRPITMLTFVAIIVWDQVLSGMLIALFSVGPEMAKALQPEVPAWMGEAIKLGLGGYVIGRSGEKIMKEFRKK